jgi:hypothetical protein
MFGNMSNKSNAYTRAEHEFLILEQEEGNAIIVPFKEEILALVDKFGKSGQSGGSAPFTAGAISSAVKKLCLQTPICDITGYDEEWMDRSEEQVGNSLYQNIRLSSIFKTTKEGRAHYLNAIVFDGDIGGTFTGSGSITLKDGTTISSRQYIKSFPFKPKTFYIKVIDHRYDKNKETGELTPNIEGDWWEHTIEDEEQLKEVFEYYDRYK